MRTAANWLSTPSVCLVASRLSARPVRSLAIYLFSYVSLLTRSDVGQSSLPSTCPVCEHSPLSADGCTIHKSLRTTIRVFVRSEEKKRDNKQKDAKEGAPETPIDAKPLTPTIPTPAAFPAEIETKADIPPEAPAPALADQPESQPGNNDSNERESIKEETPQAPGAAVSQVCYSGNTII